MNVLFYLYRCFLGGVLRLLMPTRIDVVGLKEKKPNCVRMWFHAASVGELESLWIVIETVAAPNVEIVLTVFSRSAEKAVARLRDSIASRCEVLYCGFSPVEGAWLTAVSRWRPDLFITAKYEAWPELWAALSLCKIPLVIIGARMRRSLRIAALGCKFFGVALPELHFVTVDSSDDESIRVAFPFSKIYHEGDPRWDRVRSRNSIGNARAKELIGLFVNSLRPWGVLGSVWSDDLKFLALKVGQLPGTLWFVPHKTDDDHVLEIENYLRRNGFKPLRTSRVDRKSAVDVTCLIVDEMGFLSELYGAADWAYVGGGFGAGVHSTIEPAIHGIPVIAGPARADRFPEIAQLEKNNQLKIVRNQTELSHWFDSLSDVMKLREQWKLSNERRFGSTSRIAELLNSFMR